MLPLPFGLSPITKIMTFLYQKTSFAKGEFGTHIDRYRSLIMSLRFMRQAVANNTAQSLVLIVEFGAQMLAAVAARVPSFNLHSPLISTLRIG